MKRIVFLLAVNLVLFSPIAAGAVSDEAFEQMRSDLLALTERLDELAAENERLRRSQAASDAAIAEVQESVVAVHETVVVEREPAWTDRISIKGDFRYRAQHDEVDLDGVDDRNRNRIRARAEITARLPGKVKTGLGFATGGDDPVSSNQTLGGGGSTKDVKLDLAYADWEAYNGLNVRGGKFKNTFERAGKSELQWDADWRPEGFDLAWDSGTFFAQGLGTYLESDSQKEDEFSFVVQTGARGQLAGIDLVGGVGYTDVDTAGKSCFFDGSTPGSACRGNSVDANGLYLYDFQVVDVFAQAEFEVMDRPLTIWGDWVKNNDADEYDTAYQVGFEYGKVSRKGTWQFRYFYEDIEPDATLALLTNSDFGGGGTDSKGNVFTGSYALNDQTSLIMGYYRVEKQDSLGLVNGGQPFDVNSLRFDFSFKYK
jgi:hypothetical protein